MIKKNKHWVIASESHNYKRRVKQRFAESNKEQRLPKKGFFRSEKKLVNNVNTEINLSTVNNDSKNDNWSILEHDQSCSTTAAATFAASNETFSISQTSSVSSSKVEDIEGESPKRKKKVFWESYYWCKYTYLV